MDWVDPREVIPIKSKKRLRNIILIDEDKCTGCGMCASGCPEGAIKIVDGKARLVGEILCDGLGACIGTCPAGAITVERREADPYDENIVMGNVVLHGQNTIKAHLEHLIHHDQKEFYDTAIAYLNTHGIKIPAHEEMHETDKGSQDNGCVTNGGGCPGSRMIDLRPVSPDEDQAKAGPVRSRLQNWPVQLKLANPMAPFFKHADLLVATDCVPFSMGSFHETFLKEKILVMFCPKLDRDIEEYVQKITEIITQHDLNSITLVHMQVPCCFGSREIIQEAIKRTGRAIPFKEVLISIQGEVVPGLIPNLRSQTR